MPDVVYRIVEHDGGWAYKLGDVFSETFPTEKAAMAAARQAAEEQQAPGDDEAISWEDESGQWHDETALGTDRPRARVAARGAEPISQARVASPDLGGRTLAADDRGGRSARQNLRIPRVEVRADPLMATLLALLCGFILGTVLRRRV